MFYRIRVIRVIRVVRMFYPKSVTHDTAHIHTVSEGRPGSRDQRFLRLCGCERGGEMDGYMYIEMDIYIYR
jgi:hypothetical protein